MVAVPKKKKKKLPKLSALIHKADKVFSKFIRERDKNICVTCGKPGQHAGHYIRRSHYALRWNPHNVHCQCIRCNTFLDGNIDAYALYMANTYGLQFMEELNRQKGPYKISREELERIINAYSDR